MSDDVTVVWAGLDAFRAAVDAWLDRTQDATSQAVVEAGEAIAGEARASFDTAGGPSTVSGQLAGSIIVTEPVEQTGGYMVQVGPSGIEYARKIELGKAGAHSGPAYPYFVPGVERAAPQFPQTFVRVWTSAQPGR